jgi:FdhD protein
VPIRAERGPARTYTAGMSVLDDGAVPPPAPPRPGNVTRTRLTTVEVGEGRRRSADSLATEEPMEIRIEAPGTEQRQVAVTMRTPGNDFELAAGFLLTEGVVAARDDVATVRYCAVPREEQHYNVVTVALTRPVDTGRLQRNFFATSSCGICGKASLDSIDVRCAPLGPGPVVEEAVVAGLPGSLREAQRVFDRTGGLHAAGLFDPAGRLLELREDVGRHNAVDKLAGHALLSGDLPLSDRVMMVSGRLSFEIVQKAAVAGIPVVCAVSAPSSLAVDAGRRFGMTLVGFLRGSRFNIYSHPERIAAGRG